MYLSEEKRAQIRTCIENRGSGTENHSRTLSSCKEDSSRNKESLRKVSQILFQARSGNEIYIPF